jgi:hypothetical protein
MAISKPEHGVPIDKMSPRQLKLYGEVRKATAGLMEPFFFFGIGVAYVLGDKQQIEDPAQRYGLLEGVLTSVVAEPKLKASYYDERFPDYKHLFSPGQYAQVYERLASLMRAAVQDARWAGLGAAHLLQTHDRYAEAEGIIPRSLGLLAIADVHMDHIGKVHERLGSPVSIEHLSLATGQGDRLEVAYTDIASGILSEYPSRLHGCPAHALPDPRRENEEEPWQSPATNLLEAAWEEISAYAFARIG